MRLIEVSISALFVTIYLLVSCSNDDNKKDAELLESGGAGAIVRTLSFTNSDLVVDDMTGVFGVAIEVQDEKNGGLLENIEVFAEFKDNTEDGENKSTVERLVKNYTSNQFTLGNNGLPITTLNVTYSELVAATEIENPYCGDQFLIRLNLVLTNGKSFSTADGNPSNIIGFDTDFSSPFCYAINLIDPIPEEKFIGMYEYESILDGPIGPSFGPSKVVELKRGNSINERYFEGRHAAGRFNEPTRKMRFVFGCDRVVFRKNQVPSFFTWCPDGNFEGGLTSGGPPILLGPNDENGIASNEDDNSFVLSFSEGYLGWDGNCGFGTVPSKVKFTKVE